MSSSSDPTLRFILTKICNSWRWCTKQKVFTIYWEIHNKQRIKKNDSRIKINEMLESKNKLSLLLKEQKKYTS